MSYTFLHTADVHLGHRQYNVGDRETDMYLSFRQTLSDAVDRDVDVILIPGDLFDSRDLPPTVLRAAERALRVVPDDVPVLVSPGNHDQNLNRRQVTWLEYLADRGLITLLQSAIDAVSSGDRPIDELFPSPEMAAEHAGTGPSGTIPGYIDLDVPALDGPLRVFGLEYRGGYIDTALEDAAEALPAINDRDGQPGATLLMAHFGVADEVPDLGAAVSYPELAPLEEIVDYLALGHIHKPYEGPDEGGPDRPNWYFNPGALEAHDTREATWPLGYYETTVTPDGLDATHQQSKRRPFYRLRFDVDEYDTWPALRDGFEAHLADEQDALAERCGKTIHRAGGDPRDPVIDLRVDGHLSFDRRDLDIDALEQLVEAATGALHVQTQVSVTTADILDLIEDLDEDAAFTDTGALRTDLLEAEVFEQVATNTPYASDAEAMAETLGRAKELVMTDGADGETVADFLRQQRRQAFAGGVGDVEHDYSETAQTADSGGVDDETFRAIHAGETVDPVEAAARSAQETPDADADDTEADTIDGGSDTDTTPADTTPSSDGETAGQAQLTDVTGEGASTEGED